MRTLILTLTALLVVGCSSSGIFASNEKSLDDLADEYITRFSGLTQKVIQHPNTDVTALSHTDITLAETAVQTYGELETAILVFRYDGSVDCSEFTQEQWQEIKRASGDKCYDMFPAKGEFALVSTSTKQRAKLKSFDLMTAVREKGGWGITKPEAIKFASAQDEQAFHSLRDKLQKKYERDIKHHGSLNP